MYIHKVNNQKYAPSFGTYLGLELQERILLAKARNLFNKEQLANLSKIESDGLDAILDITKNYTVRIQNKIKNPMEIKRNLSLKNYKEDKIDIMDMSDVFVCSHSNQKVSFIINRFLKIFNDDFNLPEKIKQAYEKLSNS